MHLQKPKKNLFLASETASGFFSFIIYLMIFFGHFSAHFPQFVHFSGSMCAMLSTTCTASDSHTFSHILHPIHPTEHTLITSFPISYELHCTRCLCSQGTRPIRRLGQAAIHLPQALHASLSTTAIPSTIWIASNGHAFTQLPKPRHPKDHPFGPPFCIMAAIWQSVIPV